MTSLQTKRKYQLQDFKDLFRALFKIEDKAIQERVLDAINGITSNSGLTCHYCGQKNNVSTNDTCTQTETEIKKRFNQEKEDTGSDNDFSIKIDKHQSYVRKRKRTKMIPKVEKSYPEEKKTTELIPPGCKKIKFRNTKAHQDNCFKEIEPFVEPFMDDDLLLNNFIATEPAKLTQDEVVKKMFVEFQNCLVYSDDGYMPIHRAIMDNNLKWLKRQVYVLKFKNIKLHELKTDSDKPDNPIQLAIKNNCIPKVLKELINFDQSYSYEDILDNDQNTLIHLAMVHLEDLETFEVLIENISNIDILQKCNIHGVTALHIGVKLNKALMCQLLISTIDRKLGIENHLTKPFKNTKEMVTFYNNSISSIGSAEKLKKVNLAPQKMKILNARDLKHGRTPLLFSLAEKSNLTISLMLLYNLADPRVKDYAEKDALEIYVEDTEMQSVINSVTDYLNAN